MTVLDLAANRNQIDCLINIINIKSQRHLWWLPSEEKIFMLRKHLQFS